MPKLDVAGALAERKAHKPLVHHITNWVTIYDCAQITRAWGCLPVMAHAVDEVAEMTSLAGALVLNIGTLTPELVEWADVVLVMEPKQVGIVRNEYGGEGKEVVLLDIPDPYWGTLSDYRACAALIKSRIEKLEV